MTKPSTKHCSAIIRSIHLLEYGLNDELDKRFRKALDQDIILLSEAREILYQLINNPTLPFVEEVAAELPVLAQPVHAIPLTPNKELSPLD